jgi:hypothetical protein
MTLQDFPLEPNETLIDTWALNYVPPNGGKYNGKCRVTNLHIIFEALLDYSASAILFKGMYLKPGSLLIIKKEDIKRLFLKKVFLVNK